MSLAGNGTRGPANVGRPLEIEEPLNRYWIHPLSRRLAIALVPTGVSPNMVSITGAVLTVAAGSSYVFLPWPGSVALGFGLHALWHVVDGADGDLARRTGKSSPTGEIVDGLCDYGGHIVVYVMLAAALSQRVGWWAWPAAAAAGLSRIVQANHYETVRKTYAWRAYGVPWLRRNLPEHGRAVVWGGPIGAFITLLARGFVELSRLVAPDTRAIDLSLARLADRPAALAQARSLCGASGLGGVKRASWLSANQRTILLGVSMALGSPVYFFIVEAVALNLVMAWSMNRQAAADTRLAGDLEALQSRVSARSRTGKSLRDLVAEDGVET